MKKKTKNHKAEKFEEVFKKNEVMMMLESMTDSIAIVAENVMTVKDELREFKEEMHEFKEEMHEFKDEMHEFKDEMHEFKEEMNEFKAQTENNFKSVFEYLSRIEDEIMDIKEELKNLDKDKADKKIIFDLIKRIEKVEKELERQRVKRKARA